MFDDKDDDPFSKPRRRETPKPPLLIRSFQQLLVLLGTIHAKENITEIYATPKAYYIDSRVLVTGRVGDNRFKDAQILDCGWGILSVDSSWPQDLLPGGARRGKKVTLEASLRWDRPFVQGVNKEKVSRSGAPNQLVPGRFVLYDIDVLEVHDPSNN